MSLTGQILIAGQWYKGLAGSFQAQNPSTDQALETVHSMASEAQVQLACAAAARDFDA